MEKIIWEEVSNNFGADRTDVLAERNPEIMDDATIKKNQTLNKQELLLKLLKSKTKKVKLEIEKADRNEILPLSWAQQQLWVISQLGHQASRAYHVPIIFRLKGRLDHEALNNAFRALLVRHEVLRSNIRTDNAGEPYQFIHHQSTCRIESHILPDKPNLLQNESTYKSLIETIVSAPFDLATDSLIRAALIKHGENDHALVLVLHHIVTDAWSMGVLTKELSILYGAYCAGHDNPLNELALQYADYALWQRNWLQGEVLDRERNYWREKLQGVPFLEFPTDRPRPPIQTYRGAWLGLDIDAEISQSLKLLGQRHGCTLFMTLLSVFTVLLHRYTQQTDFCVGTPIANRLQTEIEPLVGFFVNTLALRIELDGSQSFEMLLKQIKAITLSAYEHQSMPFERVVNAVNPERSQAHSPIFQAMMVLHNVKGSDLDLPGLNVEYEHVKCSTSQFDLSLALQEFPDGNLSGGFEYASDLFDESTIARMGTHFIELVKVLSANPEHAIGQVEFLTAQEKHQLLVERNDTAAPYPKDKCIHELFEMQVAQNPDAVAVVFEDQELTYGELNKKSNQLAHYLIQERGVKPDTLVGICVERSLQMVIGIVGILKAGGAYVPLDPDYPQARLRYMLEDANLTTVITQTHLKDKAQLSDDCAVYINDVNVQSELSAQAICDIPPKEIGLISSHLAYVIYTSGSTGKPKGVMIEHDALENRINWMDCQYGSSASDRVLQKTPFSFDVSVWEFVWPLTSGAAIVLAKPGGHKDPAYLSELICAQKVTKLHFVPSMLASMLANGDLANGNSLRQVFCSGEALQLSHVKEFQSRYPEVELHNLYGPTEAAIDVSYWDCAKININLSTVPIGRPIQNIQLFIFDGQLNVLPQGVAGELHIGGAGLARGYLNRPDLIAEKFIGNPFYDPNNPASSERLYKTGDLCRYLPDGNIEFLGRIDHQVKVRGFRIELGEIESALTLHELVKDAVVLVRENTSGEKQLVAYIVSGKAIEVADLKCHLLNQLPDYMIPSAFVVLDVLPLTPNGKVDRKLLSSSALPRDNRLKNYKAPSNTIERNLVSLWVSVLELDENSISVEDDFFTLGGNSLSAILLAKKISNYFSIEFTVPIIFKKVTIKEQSSYIATRDDFEITHKDKIEMIVRKHNVSDCVIFELDEKTRNIHVFQNYQNVSAVSQYENSTFKSFCLMKLFSVYTALHYFSLHNISLNQTVAQFFSGGIFEKLSKGDVRILDLMRHTSGIDDSLFQYIYHNTESLDNAIVDAERVDFFAHHEKQVNYSGTGIILLMRVVEVITSLSWEDCFSGFLDEILSKSNFNNIVSPKENYSNLYRLKEKSKLTFRSIYESWDCEFSNIVWQNVLYITLNSGKSESGKQIINASYISVFESATINVENHFLTSGWTLGWTQFDSGFYGYWSAATNENNLVAFSTQKNHGIIIQSKCDHSVEFFNDITESLLGKRLTQDQRNNCQINFSSCVGTYKSQGITIKIAYSGDKFSAGAIYKNEAGVIISDNVELIKFNNFNFAPKDIKPPFWGLFGFSNFDKNGIPQFLKVKQTLLVRVE
jgi:amino acid adenylation domain-containing protein